MTVMELVGRLAGHKRKAELQRVGDYRELVAKLARGEKAGGDDAVAAMEAAGKTADDLTRDVAQAQRRIVLREQAAKLPEARAELDRLTTEQAKAVDQFNAMQRRHFADEAERRTRINELLAFTSGAANAEAELFAQCGDPRIVEQIRLLSAEGVALLAEERRLRERFRTGSESGRETEGGILLAAQRKLRDLKAKLDDPQVTGQRKADLKLAIADAEGDAGRAEESLRPARERLAEIAKQRAWIDAEQAKLYARAIEAA